MALFGQNLRLWYKIIECEPDARSGCALGPSAIILGNPTMRQAMLNENFKELSLQCQTPNTTIHPC